MKRMRPLFGGLFAVPTGIVSSESLAATVGDHETMFSDCQADFSEIVETPYAVRFEKIGSDGALAIDSALGRGEIRLGVASGKLEMTDAGTQTVVETAPAATQKALLWLDAEKNVLLTADQTGVAQWYDVRETETDGVYGTTYPAAVAAKIPSATSIVYPTVETDTESGRTMINFGGSVTSGKTMNFVAAANRGSTIGLTDLRHAFIVLKIENTPGWFFGNTSVAYFHMDRNTGNYLDSNTRTATASGTFCLNGALFDPQNTKFQRGMQLIDWRAGRETVVVNNFFNDRNYTPRQGGDNICEALFFTQQLTPEEHVAIQEYLLQKWKGKGLAPVDLTVAEGASAIIGTSARTLSVRGGGAIAVRTTNAATLTDLRGSTAFDGSFLPIDSAYGLVANRDEIPLASKAGMSVSVTRDTNGGNYQIGPVASIDSRSVAFTDASPVAKAIVRTTDIPAGVTNVTMNGGVLSLGAAADVTHETVPLAVRGESVAATFAMATFENAGAWSSSQGTKYGWTADFTADGHLYFCGPNWSSWSCPYNPPIGDWVLGIKIDKPNVTGIASTTVEVPQRGNYDLSFLCCARANNKILFCDLGLAKGSVTNWFGGAVCYPLEGYTIRRYRTPVLEPGTWTFLIRGKAKDDAMGTFTDFRMTLSSEQDNLNVVPVPNGNFERVTLGSTATLMSVHYTNAADGWTIYRGSNQGAQVDTMPAAGLGTIATGSGYYNYASSRYGNTQLCFYGSEGSATSDAFEVLPAGTWRLKCRASRWGQSAYWPAANTPISVGSVPVFNVTATINGTVHSLGAITVADRIFEDYVFPTTVTVASGDSVSLTIRQMTAQASALIDDLVFVPVSDEMINLVSEGCFEGRTGWKLVSPTTEQDGTGRSEAAYQSKTSFPESFGYNWHEGTYALKIVDNGSAEQNVLFPAAGTYRLSFWARPRVHSLASIAFKYAGNKISAYLKDGSGTQPIMTTESLYTTNFVRYASVFTVPAAGSYTFGLKGLSSASCPLHERGEDRVWDACALIDDVQISKIANGSLTLPEDLTLNLTSGAKLDLDYIGTNKVMNVFFDGRRKSGVINAERFPDLVTGSGALFVKPLGFTIILR